MWHKKLESIEKKVGIKHTWCITYHLGLTMKLLKCRTNCRILWEKHLSILKDFIVTNDKLGYSRQKKLFFHQNFIDII